MIVLSHQDIRKVKQIQCFLNGYLACRQHDTKRDILKMLVACRKSVPIEGTTSQEGDRLSPKASSK